jgi:WD40 repeat protein
MNQAAREDTMQIGNFTSLAHVLAVSSLWTAMSASANQDGDWNSYRFRRSAFACAFTPDSRSVVVLYGTARWISGKEFVIVDTTHLAAWDFKTGKVEDKRKWDYTTRGRGDHLQLQPRYMKYTADGRSLVILDASAIRMLDAATYTEVKTIAFEPPEEKFARDGWSIVSYFGPGFSVTPDGSRAAVAFSSSMGGNGGFVRVYDLRQGQVVREWRLQDAIRFVTGVALSSDGKRVAVSSLPFMRSSEPEAFIPSGTNNVQVMDVKTGETLVGMNTKYVAGAVLFGPNDTLLTGSINNDRTGYSLDTVKIWDTRSGKLLREIANPGAGVHYRLDRSVDGKLLLGYTGAEKPDENFVVTDFDQFKIWDFASGKEVAASPKFSENGPHTPQLQLSQDEKYVVAWWDGFAEPIVYEIPQH